MRVLVLVGLVALSSACTCGGPSLTKQYGELVVIEPGPPEVATHEAVIQGPDTQMGSQTALHIKLRNVGVSAITLTHLELTEGSNAYSVELPPLTQLNAQDETELTVLFTPPQDEDPTVAAISHHGLITLTAEGTKSDESIVTIDITTRAVSGDCGVPARVDFGIVPLDSDVAFDVPLDNHSDSVETPTIGPFGGDDAANFSTPTPVSFDIAPQTAATLSLHFRATELRTFHGTVTLRRAARCPRGVIELVGTGSNDAFTVTPRRLDFGHVQLSTSALQLVQVRSRSNVPLVVAGAATQGDGFGVMGGGTVAPQGALDLFVTCEPQTPGARTGSLTFKVGQTTVSVPLTCSGGGPRLRMSPANLLPFGTVPVTGPDGIVTTRRRLSLFNVGNPPPSPNLRLGRGDGGAPYFFVVPRTGATGATWSVELPPTYSPSAGLPGIAGQNAVDVQVTFTPRTVGSYEADLIVYSNDAIQPAQSIRLTAVAALTTGCLLSIGPSPLNFGMVPPGAQLTQTVVVQNSGLQACTLTGAELVGLGYSWPVGAPPASISVAPGATTAISVRLTVPGNAAEGATLSGTLHFNTNDLDHSSVDVPLSALVSRCLVMTPDRLDFGTLKVNCMSAPRTVYLYNMCSSPVLLRQVTPPQAPFAVTQLPTIPMQGLQVLPGGSPVTLQLRFAPQQTGPVTDAVTLNFSIGGVSQNERLALSGDATTDGLNTETFVQPANPKADILFTIDDSCSMSDEQSALSQNLTTFLGYARANNVQFNLGVTTTDDDDPTKQGRLRSTPSNPKILTQSTPSLDSLFADKVLVGIRGSGVERPLSTSLKAVTSPLTVVDNAGLLRPEATLSVIIVTDAVDQSNEPISYFINRFRAVKGPDRAWMVSVSVVGPFQQTAGCMLDGAIDSNRYAPLITATAGVKANICSADWAQALERVARTTFGGRLEFPLSGDPSTSQPISVTVNGQRASNATYDPVSHSVDFTGTPPMAGATVAVTYTSACF